MTQWEETRRRPVLPFYLAALVWPVAGLLLPLYQLWALALTIVCSAAVGLAAARLCPARIVRCEVPYTTGSEDADAMIAGITADLDRLRALNLDIPDKDLSALMDRMAKLNKRLFLLGAKPGVAEEAARRLTAQHPGLTVCGVHDGYFQEDAPVVQSIREAGADVDFVCLGAPKQEKWAAAHGGETGARLLVGLGGSLDVFAGQVDRAPESWQRLGLEWLYRTIRQPSRFKRVAKLPGFLLSAVGARIQGK